MTIQITIVGLGQVGASIGLALKEHKDLVKRIGHDRESSVARQAEKMGAVDSISLNLPASVRGSDLVLLTEPLDQILDTVKFIVQDLHEGTVVMDTAPAKSGLAEYMRTHLPAGRHYVSLYPAINPAYLVELGAGIDAAHDDLFRGGLVAITAPRGANAEALKLASDLVGLLGAEPLFSDEAEVDGLVASSVLLPQVAAAALLNATTEQPGWRESRKLAASDYAFATLPVDNLSGIKILGQSMLLNRENTVRVVDNLIGALQDLRRAIDENNTALLQERLESARAVRQEWIKQRSNANWANVENPQPAPPSTKEVWGRMIGLRRHNDDQKERK